MPNRYWGVVCVCLALASNPVFAQQGPPASAPIGEAERSGTADGSDHPALPVVILETPDQAEHGAEREAKGDKHEAEDLAAQRQAADAADRGATSADRQVVPAWWQAGLATLGAIGLFITIYLTNRSLKLTRESNDHARTSSEQALRAYVVTKELRVKSLEAGRKPVFEVLLINSGQTPARRLQMVAGFATVADRSGKFRLLEKDKKHPRGSEVDIGAGLEYRTAVTGEKVLDGPSLDALRKNEMVILVGAYSSYLDIFGNRHRHTAKGYLVFDQEGRPELLAAPSRNHGN